MTLRSFFLTLGTLVLGALTLAAASLFWLLSQSPLQLSDGGTLAAPTAAMFVPRQAPIVASLVVNPSRLEALLQLQTPLGDRRRVQREFDAITAGLLRGTGLSYRRDIRRWLGDEITVAVTALDFDRDPENGAQPGYLLIATAQQGALARNFLQVFFARSALAGVADLEFEPYKGTTLIYPRRRDTGATPLASALVGDRYLLVANHPQVLREAINNVQATRLSLAQAPAYQQALASLEEPRLGLIFANLPALAAVPPGALPPEPPTLLLALQTRDRQLVAQAALTGLTPTTASPPAAAPLQVLDYLPADSSVAIAGRDLQSLWAHLQASFPAGSPLGQLLSRALGAIEAPLGINLAEDIFAWAQGDYALALLPSGSGPAFDWVFAAERSDGAAAAIAHLDDLARAQDLSLGTVPLGDTKVTAWTQLVASQGKIQAEVRGVRGRVGNVELLASSFAAIAPALTPAESAPQANRAFLATLPATSRGYFYLDWPRSRPLLEENLPGVRLLLAAGQPLLERLRSLALANTGNRDGLSQATITFRFGTAPES